MLFSFRSFLNNFTLDNSNHVSSAWQVKKIIIIKKVNSWQSETLNHVFFWFFVFFVSSVRIHFPTVLIKLCCLILFFQKNFMNISCVHDTFMKYISGTRSIANVLTATKSNRNLSNMWLPTLRSLRRSFAPLQKPSSILRYVNIHSEIC